MKTMKRALLVAVCCSVLLAAGCAGVDAVACYETVKAAYPRSQISIIPGGEMAFFSKNT